MYNLATNLTTATAVALLFCACGGGIATETDPIAGAEVQAVRDTR